MPVRHHNPRPNDIVSERHLEFLTGWDRKQVAAIAERAGAYYRPFDMRRTPGSGKWRHIDNPNDELKALQRSISQRILQRVPLPGGMLGGVHGASIRDNAELHKGQAMLVTLDIADCFPSIESTRVLGVFADIVGCSKDIAITLTKLTTLNRCLPQGAASSMALANLALLPLYRDVERICIDAGLTLSFWVDDIAISGVGAELVLEDVIRCVQSHGFAIRRRKVQVMPSGGRQAVTGVVANRRPSVGRRYIESIAQEIFALDGVRGVPKRTLTSINGRISHVAQTNPGPAARLRRHADRLIDVSNTEKGMKRGPEYRDCERPRQCRRGRKR